MTEIEKHLILAAFMKWITEEPLSIPDFRRILTIFKTKPLNIYQGSQEELASLKAEWLATLRSQLQD